MSFIRRTLTYLSDFIPQHKLPTALVPRQIPNIQLPDQDEYSNADACTLHALCSSCREVLHTSSHIKGTFFPLLSSTERFTLWHSLEDLRSSVRSRCHFCTVVWQVISKDRAGKTRTDEEISNLGISQVVLEIVKSKDIQINIACKNLEKSLIGHIAVWDHDGRGCLPANTTHPAQSQFLTSSNEHVKLASYWFQECSIKHKFCHGPDLTFMPTRLIQIDDTNNGLIKVINSTNSIEKIPYCALSHSWGGATDILTLNSKNLDELSSVFSVQGLPKTFRDAIEITQWLGHRHLWLDCLCIIQDSEEDWAFEASRMSSVYENSSCTIAAMTGKTPHDGCFERRDPLSFSPCRIAISDHGALFAHAVDRPSGDIFTVQHQYLNTRAWVLQERIFSPRILCFTGTGIFWSCRAGCATERDQDGWGHPKKATKEIFGSTVTSVDWISRINNVQTDNFEDLLSYCHPKDARTSELFSTFWFKVVTAYSARNLTVSTDKLIAISSIANRIQEESGFQYVAGLWMETFYADLLWNVSDRHIQDRPKSYCAPSWSWASVDGVIHWQGNYSHDEHIEHMIKIVNLDIQLHPENKNRTGPVIGGALFLEGFLKKPFKITKSDQSDANIDAKGRLEIVLNEPPRNEQGYNPLYLDFSLTSKQISGLLLLPLRRATRQDWNHPHPDPTRNPHLQYLQGLAVLECSDSGVYERVGFFSIHCRKPYFLATNWFSDAPAQAIKII